MKRQVLTAATACLITAIAAARSTAAECSADDAAEAAIAKQLYAIRGLSSTVCGVEKDDSPAACDLRVFEDLLGFRRVKLRDDPEVVAYFVQPRAPVLFIGVRGDPAKRDFWLFRVNAGKPVRLLSFYGHSLDLDEPSKSKHGFRSLLGIEDDDNTLRFEWTGRSYKEVPLAPQRK